MSSQIARLKKKNITQKVNKKRKKNKQKVNKKTKNKQKVNKKQKIKSKHGKINKKVNKKQKNKCYLLEQLNDSLKQRPNRRYEIYTDTRRRRRRKRLKFLQLPKASNKKAIN